MQGCGGSHDLAPNSSATSVIGLESPLFAVLACLVFSRKNYRSAFSDFCNTIDPKRTSGECRENQEIIALGVSDLIHVKAGRQPGHYAARQKEKRRMSCGIGAIGQILHVFFDPLFMIVFLVC